jgi:hypothetical protein
VFIGFVALNPVDNASTARELLGSSDVDESASQHGGFGGGGDGISGHRPPSAAGCDEQESLAGEGGAPDSSPLLEYSPTLLPAIVVLTSSPHVSSVNTLLAARSIVLNRWA